MSDARSARVLRWREAWHSGDAQRVAALYAPDATHDSAKVAAAMPSLGGRTVLASRDEILTYAQRAFARVGWLRFEFLNVVESENLSVMEYARLASTPHHIVSWRFSNGTASL
ncbi:MAG: nuclear transport factor 2 family protein [Alphaproteobacteria bacterium]|nr:nuclear transport factor 2 family protein [Alphaproteobacteria bacterium]